MDRRKDRPVLLPMHADSQYRPPSLTRTGHLRARTAATRRKRPACGWWGGWNRAAHHKPSRGCTPGDPRRAGRPGSRRDGLQHIRGPDPALPSGDPRETASTPLPLRPPRRSVGRSSRAAAVNAPWDLRVEHLGDGVLGLGEARPRLSWKLPHGARRQHTFEVELDGGPCDLVESRDHVLVPWPGDALASRQRVVWRVRVRTEVGDSPWSAPAWFEMGLLQARDWMARWIEPAETAHSAHVLSRRFHLDAPPGTGR